MPTRMLASAISITAALTAAACTFQLPSTAEDPRFLDGGRPPMRDASSGMSGGPHDATAIDAPKRCDDLAPFHSIGPLAGFATAEMEGVVRLTPDELTMYFSGTDLFVAKRAHVTADFGPRVALAVNSATAADYDPFVSSDGQTLLFGSSRADPTVRLWRATWSSAAQDFVDPVALPLMVATTGNEDERQPFVSADGEELWFSSTSSRPGAQGGADIWYATRMGAAWANAAIVPALSSAHHDWLPTLSADRRTIYIASDRPLPGSMVSGTYHIWRSHRPTVIDPWSPPSPVTELNGSNHHSVPGWLSADGCRLYYSRNVLNYSDADIYVAERS
ncbi:MAG: TolB family protein [Kofleriaceae bacterium]